MESDLRRWMRLVEATTGGHTVRVFHGSPEPKLNLRGGVIYGTRNFGFAAGYAVHRRGNETGYVHTLDFHFKKLATEADVYSLAQEYEIELGSHVTPVTVIDQHHHDFNDDILDGLLEHGFDGITGYDDGFDGAEDIVWAVFNPIRQISLVAVTPVSKMDVKRRDAPS